MLVWVLYKIDLSQCGKDQEHILQGRICLDEQEVKPISDSGHFALSNLYADTNQTYKAPAIPKEAEVSSGRWEWTTGCAGHKRYWRGWKASKEPG